MIDPIVKTCSCCKRTFTRAEWLSLPFVGIGFLEVEDGEELVQEYRNCNAQLSPPGTEDRGPGTSLCDSTLTLDLATVTDAGRLVRRMAIEHGQMVDALRSCQARCTELVNEVRALRGQAEMRAQESKPPVPVLTVEQFQGAAQRMSARAREMERLYNALVPLVAIADAYDENALDDEARKRWGPNLEHENVTSPDQIELFTGRGGRRLLTLQQCLDARKAVRG